MLCATRSRTAISASPAPASRHPRARAQSASVSFGFGPDGRTSPAAPCFSARWRSVATYASDRPITSAAAWPPKPSSRATATATLRIAMSPGG